MREIMKLITTLAFVFSTIAVAFANASTIRIEFKDGYTQFLTEDGIVQEEYFTREQDPQAYCLAENIYFEARSDSVAGQAAVADVVINRMFDSRYPDTICGVVHDGPVRESWKTRQTPDPDDAVYYPIKDRCQFSWYCDGKAETINDRKAWIKAQYIAYQMLYADRYRGITEGATHYHAHYVNPTWASKIQYIDSIGSHKFYRHP
jgi:spore germination cell wall hydrolase CwlJ-like protein